MEANPVTFLANDGASRLEGIWHLPVRRATNGAVIVLHDLNDNQAEPLYAELCQAAARLGLSALRFNFRFVQSGSPADFHPLRQGVEDLEGAYNFFLSFGKEMKPKRYYLIGKGAGGLAALALATKPAFSATISGVAVLGLSLPVLAQLCSGNSLDITALQAPLLVIQPLADPAGSLAEVRVSCSRLAVACQLEVLDGSSEAAGLNSTGLPLAKNPARAVELTINWLGQQDAHREDLRK